MQFRQTFLVTVNKVLFIAPLGNTKGTVSVNVEKHSELVFIRKSTFGGGKRRGHLCRLPWSQERVKP